jgi:hypothetical protein
MHEMISMFELEFDETQITFFPKSHHEQVFEAVWTRQLFRVSYFFHIYAAVKG